MRNSVLLRSFVVAGLCLSAMQVRSDARGLPLTADTLAGAWKLVSIEYSGRLALSPIRLSGLIPVASSSTTGAVG
jgi:hypothetical protein